MHDAATAPAHSPHHPLRGNLRRNPVFPRNIGLAVDVDLGESDAPSSGVFLGEGLVNRGDLFARAAPYRVEVHNNVGVAGCECVELSRRRDDSW